MLIQAFGRRLVVVRRRRQETLRARTLHFGGGVNHLARVVSARAGKDQGSPFRFFDDDLDDASALGG